MAFRCFQIKEMLVCFIESTLKSHVSCHSDDKKNGAYRSWIRRKLTSTSANLQKYWNSNWTKRYKENFKNEKTKMATTQALGNRQTYSSHSIRFVNWREFDWINVSSWNLFFAIVVRRFQLQRQIQLHTIDLNIWFDEPHLMCKIFHCMTQSEIFQHSKNWNLFEDKWDITY